MADRPHNESSAEDRAHGAHGKGDSRESFDSPSPTGAGNSGNKESDPRAAARGRSQDGNLGDAGWGSGSAGGSVADKRPPK